MFELLRDLPVTVFAIVMEKPVRPLPRSDSRLPRQYRYIPGSFGFPKSPRFRHSGESRNPAFHTARRFWVPAFAGTTGCCQKLMRAILHRHCMPGWVALQFRWFPFVGANNYSPLHARATAFRQIKPPKTERYPEVRVFRFSQIAEISSFRLSPESSVSCCKEVLGSRFRDSGLGTTGCCQKLMRATLHRPCCRAAPA